MKKAKLLFSLLVVLFSINANAKIVYTDIKPDVTTTLGVGGHSAGNIVAIDFNQDGTQEYNFRWDDYGATGWFMHMTYATGNEFNLKGTSTNPYGGRYIQAMTAGSIIDASANWGNSVPEPFIGDNSDPNFQNLGDKYVGVKFFIGSKIYYGWVLVSFNSSKKLTIKEYAYENTPNTAIKAGDVGGTTQTSYDIAMDSISINSIAIKGNIIVKGRIKNIGTATVNSFSVKYKINNGQTTSDEKIICAKGVESNKTYDFVCTVPWKANSPGNQTIKIIVSNPNGKKDINIANNSKSKQISILSEKFTKTLVCEEVGGTWCKFCPRGIVGLNTMAHKYSESEWIGISIHIKGFCYNNYPGEPMIIPLYPEGIRKLLKFAPTGIIDRNPDAITNMTMPDLLTKYNLHKTDIPVAETKITNQTWNETKRSFTVDIKTKFALDINNANYRLALVVLEDDVTGTEAGWEQHDFFQGISIPMIDWDGFNYNTKGTLVIEGEHYVPAKLMHYNHVARQLIGGWNGVENSIPTTITHGNQYSYTFTGAIPTGHNPKNTSFVVLLIDSKTGRIVNANKAKFNGTVGISESDNNNSIIVFPNPSNGVFRIDNKKGSQITVYNIMGQEVYKQSNSQAIEVLDLSALHNGIYIIKISNSDSITTKRIIITK